MTDDRPNHENDSFPDHEPEELRMAIESIRMQDVPEQSMQKTLRAAESIGMTGAAWKRGLINMVAIGLPMAVLIELAKRLFGGQTQFEKLMAVFWITTSILVVCVLVGLVQACMGARRSGQVLIDGGAHPGRKLFWINVLTMTCFGAAALWAGPTSIPPAMGFALIGFALFFATLSLDRLQFCDSGIWQYWNLLPWDKIQSYEFAEGTNPTLLIRTTSKIPFLRRGAFPVPQDIREQVESLLADQVGTAGE